MFEIFKNGSKVVNRRLMLIDLALSCLLMAVVLIQGYIPSLDFLSHQTIRLLAFGFSAFAALLKAGEMFFSKAASLYAADTDPPHNLPSTPQTKTNIEETDMNNKGKLTALLLAGSLMASSICANAQVFGLNPTNSTGSFIDTVRGYFTTFNPNLTNTFQAKTTLWTGVDSVSGGGASMINEIGVSYVAYGPLSIESITRDGGVTGTLVSESIGLGLNFNVVDTRLTVYADAGYQLDSAKGSKFTDDIYGEIGLRVSKALTEHTFAWVGMGAKFPKQERIFAGGVGFTF